MARATTKVDLINSAEIAYQKLLEKIASLTKEQKQQNFSFDTLGKKEAHWHRDKNIRDVIIHLYEWQLLLIKWVDSNQKGKERKFLEAPYTWKNYQAMNKVFWEKHQQTSYEDAMMLLDKSHHETMDMIKNFTNDELFSKDSFVWTAGSTLGTYCAANTASHYLWAYKKVNMHAKTFK